MMQWLFGATLLPLILCGLMCVGGAVLAALGLRRSRPSRSVDAPPPTQAVAPSESAARVADPTSQPVRR
jgi:hypothetical protein